MKLFPASSNGLEDKTWQQYCSFLKLSIEEFQAIQNEQLEESLHLVATSPLGKRLLNGKKPHSYRELIRIAPLTDYQDYASYFNRKDDSILPEKPIYWAFTSTSGGSGKWIPFTEAAHDMMLNYLMAAFILSSSNEPGEVKVKAGDIGIYNLAPRPFLSGYLALGMSEKFDFRAVPPIPIAESMDITERVEKGFQMALRSGVDIVISLASVLVKIGEAFTHKQTSSHFSWSYLHPSVLSRWTKAYTRSRMEKRQILPKDLWHVKALIGWGLDTEQYREKIEYYWGMPPYELDACTEVGLLALQDRNGKGLIPLPQAAFFEFLPETEWIRNRAESRYTPTTVLLDNLEPGHRYELVVTSFHGMPFIRYRTGHVMKVLSTPGSQTWIQLPQIAFVGRSDDVIDLAGFTRLDEKTLWQAISRTLPDCFDWIAIKEYKDNKAFLHLYLETTAKISEMEAIKRLHQNLRDLDPAYDNLESMLGLKPLQVSLMANGTFQRYYERKKQLRENKIESRLPHINPPAEAVKQLLEISKHKD